MNPPDPGKKLFVRDTNNKQSTQTQHNERPHPRTPAPIQHTASHTWSTWKKDVCPGSHPVGPGGTITSMGAMEPTRAGAGTRWFSMTSRMSPSSPLVKMKPTLPTILGRSCAREAHQQGRGKGGEGIGTWTKHMYYMWWSHQSAEASLPPSTQNKKKTLTYEYDI